MYARRTAFHILIALALVFGLAAALPTGSVKAADWTVCASGCTYTTIQAAIATAGAGDTITVSAGTYAENLTVNKAVALVGPLANVDVSGRTAAGPDEATIQGLVTVTASDVSINGFSLTNPGQPNAVVVNAAANSFTFNCNIVDTVGAAGLADNVHAVHLSQGPDSAVITSNLFKNIRAGAKSVSAVGVLDSTSTDASTGLYIRWNIFTNISSDSKGAYGIIINNKAGAPGAQILDNTFSGLSSGGWTHAIGLEGPTPGAVVTGNTFTGLTAAGADNAAILFQANPVGGTVNVSMNAFNGSGYFGVAVHPDDFPYNYTVDADRNYWGAATGPGTTTQVGPNVAYAPYWTDAPMTTLGGPVHNVTQDTWFTTIQPAIDASVAGDVIEIFGTHVLSSAVNVNKDVTLSCDPAALIQVSGTGYRIQLTAAGASLAGCSIQKTDKAGVQNIIYVAANDLTIQDNTIWGQFVIGEGDVSRAMEFTGGLSGLLITNNEIHHLRQPAYINGLSSGTISNNYVYATKGWVVAGGNLTFTGNTWGTGANANVFDIAILSGVGPLYYTDVPAMSAANNNASIEDQRTAPATLNPVYVDASAPACAADCGTAAHPYPTLAQGVTRVTPGGTIYVAAGTYTEVGQMVIRKNMTIIGEDKATTIIKPAQNTGGSGDAGSWILVNNDITFNLSKVTLDGVGKDIRQGIRFNGSGVVDNVIIQNMVYPGYSGWAICQGYSNTNPRTLSVTNSTFTNFGRVGIQTDNGTGTSTATIAGNTITCKGAGDHLDYGIYVEGGSVATISGNTITNCRGVASTDGSTSAAIAVSTSFAPGTVATITGNTLTDSTTGIAVGYDATDTASVKAESNLFSGNDYDITSTNPPVDGSPNWFGSINGPEAGTIYGDVTYIPWCGEATCTTLITPTVHNVTQDTYHITIQHAIDNAADGDVIEVGPGLYPENIDVTKPVTLLGPNEGIAGDGTRVAEAVIQGTAASWVSLYVEPDVPGVTIDGFTFDGTNLVPSGYSVGVAGDSSDLTVQNNIFINHNDMAIMTSGVYYDGGWKYDKYLQNILIKDNLITNSTLSTSGFNFGIYLQSSLGNVTGNIVTNMRNGIQVQPYNTPGGGIVSGNTFNTYRTGIYFNYTQNALADWEFTGNTIEGIAYPVGLDPVRFNAIRVETFYNGNVDFNLNQILPGTSNATELYQYFENNVTNGVSSATPNWWGNWYGPSAGSVSPADTLIAPWCADVACTTFLPVAGKIEIPAGTPGADVQAILNNVTTGTEIKFLGSMGPLTGGYVINTPHLTIILADGTVIQNNSPCFVVNADYTTITTASIGGAQCVPTSGSNGIDVTGVRKNITITGIEFVGTAGTDGIHFGTSGTDSITDIVLVDNWFHGFTGDGIEFFTQPLGTIEIHGNLFQANGGLGINASTFTVPAKYNSWGHYDGPAAPNGDGISANVDADPWTHVNLYMVSSDTPWADQVVAGQNITYTVYGNLRNMNTADFTLRYPAGLAVVSTAAGGTFGTEDITFPATGSINFLGSTFAGIETGLAQPLFTVTFTATADSILNLDELTDGFGMPGAESSTNVYAAALEDKTVNVIDLPTITPVSLTDTYIIGTPNEFTLTINNPASGALFTDPALVFTLPAGSVLEYDSGAGWVAVTAPFDPGDLATNSTVTITFRVTLLVGPGSYPLTVELFDTLPTPDALLATATGNATVTTLPAVIGTFSMEGRSTRAGIPVTLTALNLTAYGPFTASTINQISDNITFNGLVTDTYLITTDQPRYLDVTSGLNITKVIDASVSTINPLMLRGGDADDNNHVYLGDASLVGSNWGTPVDPRGDVNFDGKVNVLDLALVGGNYNLTSAGAYGTWVP